MSNIHLITIIRINFLHNARFNNKANKLVDKLKLEHLFDSFQAPVDYVFLAHCFLLVVLGVV